MIKKQQFQSGFSLIEMVVVIAIFVIITAVVLVNAPQFRERTNLELISQEMSLHIRGAQVYGLATRQISPNDDYNAFGIHFNQDSKQGFYLYGAHNPSDGDGSGDEVEPIENYKISGGHFEIIDLKCDDSSENSLSIIFQRPETKAIFYTNGGGEPDNNCDSVSITVKSLRENKQKDIVVAKSGQIYLTQTIDSQ